MKEGKKKGGGDCHVMLLQCMFKYTNKYTLEPLLICELFVALHQIINITNT